MSARPIQVGLIGCGTVGAGVAEILERRAGPIAARVGAPVKLRWVCDRDLRRAKALGLDRRRLTSNVEDVLRDPAVDIVVELVGGYEPARTFILEALRRGKHVATANKAVLAKYWTEIFSTAQKHHALVYFEASVGAGIPVIQGLNEGLAANRIQSILGILNGTTNYILSRMSRDGAEFGAALKAAQKAGFAEADPTFDVEGMDAVHKLAILGALAFGAPLPLESIAREGITGIEADDVRYAQTEFGYVLKLLGIARRPDARPDRPGLSAPDGGVVHVEAGVYPTLIPRTHPFANVQDEYNAMLITGDAVGDVMFYGKGAGQGTAASGVAGDIIYLARHVHHGTAGRVALVVPDASVRVKVISPELIEARQYLRFTTLDRPGVLSRIAGILSRHGVSIASIVQKEPRSAAGSRRPAQVQILMLTHKALEGRVRRALADISRLAVVKAPTRRLRVEDGTG